MKNLTLIAFALTLLMSSVSISAQVKRSDEFHSKYQLKEVAIFSRHNVRAPITGGSSLLGIMTPHKWIDWTASESQLTMKGGMLETANGEYFHQWAVSEGLFEDNAMPTSDEAYFYANSKQRCIATARYFLSGFLPVSDLQVTWTGEFDKMNPDFNLSFYNVTDSMRDVALKQFDEKYGVGGLRRLSESVDSGLKLIQNVLDLKESEAYKQGKITAFGDNPDHNLQFFFKEGDEPYITGSVKDAANASDALTLQYYQDLDSVEAGFGHNLTREQRRAIFAVKDLENGLRWSIPCIYKPLAQVYLNKIASELKNPTRKFFFMCGHDANIFCLVNALNVNAYAIDNAVEGHVPIGSKIVFEKWTDAAGKEYIAVNHVYQSLDQVRNIEVLTDSNPPVIKPLTLKDVKANEDGLYPFDEFINFIENVNTPEPTSVTDVAAGSKVEGIYDVQGLRHSEMQPGINIIQMTDGTAKKVLVK